MFGNMFEAPREDHSEQEEIELNDKILAELEPQIGAVYALDIKEDLMLVSGDNGYALVAFDENNHSDQEIEEIGGEEVESKFGEI